MKALPEYFKSMYVVAIALLLLLAAIASYNLRAFPANLLIAVLACSVLDLLIARFFLKRKELKFPYSGFISGTIIGSIAPLNAPVAAILVAAAAAIASKYVMRLKGRHIFNPATLGLLVSLWLFRLGDQWWAAAGISVLGFAIPITLILIIANYKADKLKVAIPFLLVTAVLYAATGFAKVPLTAPGLLTFAGTMPYYFAFIMLSEPKTSPSSYNAREQVVFGTAVAAIYFALDFNSVKFPFFIALLAGNLAYSLYRSGLFLQKKQGQKA